MARIVTQDGQAQTKVLLRVHAAIMFRVDWSNAMSDNLIRFSVAMPEDLLVQLDALVNRRGVLKNRSEVMRDLVRDALIREEAAQPGAEVMGSLTIVYDHHAHNLQDRLYDIQHERFSLIVATTHVHLDADSCLETIIMRGEATEVRDTADLILGTKGVKNGGLVITTTGQMV